MLIVGAKGFAKEVLEIFHQKGSIDKLAFYDDVNDGTEALLFDKFPILRSLNQAEDFFLKNGKEYIIGLGVPKMRYKVYTKFKRIGGILVTTISPNSDIGHYNTVLGDGCIITSGVVITNDISIGKGCLINLNTTIGHDSIIGDFVEICPNVNISGNCEIGKFSFIGTSASILPNIKIGENVIIAAGAVVTKNVPHNTLVAGVPAKIIKNLNN